MTVLAPTTTVPTLDPRVEAFCSTQADVAFTTVVHPGGMWRPDPFDVKSIHADAREAFDTLLARAADADRAEHGKIFLVRGTGGSGKTHLMRAFRHTTHEAGGYAGYLQMVSQSSDYSRYVLSYLIDSLDRPYRDPVATGSGLVRIAKGLLEAIGTATPDEKQEFIESPFHDEAQTIALVNRFADFAVQDDHFDDRDLDLIRALLYLLPPDGRLKSRVMKWLRCEELTPADRALLGGLATPPADGAALRMIAGLGRVIAAAHKAPFVLLVDQLEETVDQSGDESESGRRFRQAVDALVNIAAHVPNAVVVVACLDSYYEKVRQQLPTPKLHRLENETPPITLHAHRTAEEVESLVSQRLAHLYAEAEVETDDPLFPFRREHLAPLAGLTIRNVLLFIHEHYRRCRKLGAWTDPPGTPKPDDQEGKGDKKQFDLAKQWNDFLAAHKAVILDEPALAKLLASTVREVSAEVPSGNHFAADADERNIQVYAHAPGNAVDRLFVAVCDKSTRGGGLGGQVTMAKVKAGDVPIVLVRSTDFPTDSKLVVSKEIAKLIAPVGKGRRVVVSNSDWRAMAAFRDFHALHHAAPGFADWQRADKPLSGLPAVNAILALDRLPVAPAVPVTPPVPPPPVGVARPVPVPPPATPAPQPAPAAGAVLLGKTRGGSPANVEFDAADFCRHAAFLGGSGSGKTTAALNVIEQLLMAGVPAVLLDRKGDLSRYADPEAWTEPDADAGRVERRARLRERLEVVVYTPGAEAGRPLAIPIVPDLAGLNSADREQLAQYAAASLGQMMGYKGKNPDPKAVILQKAIEVLARVAGQAVTVKALQQIVSDRDDALVNELGGFEDRHFKKLDENLLTLAHQHRRLLEGGEPLDIDELLGRGPATPAGKVRLSVVNTQFLGDEGTVDFWVAQFLACVSRWASKNPAPGRLQAVFLFDEADLYLPANKQPATKAPMEGLLKRSRSAGVGLFLATQSPGDLDYKCRDQVLTWLVGRVKEPTAIGKLRPMLERRPDAADKLAGQAAGEFYLVRESGVGPIGVGRNLIPTAQVPEDRVLALARGPA